MKNNTSNKPLWLRRMNIIALIAAVLMFIAAIAFSLSIFGGFSGVLIFDIFVVIAVIVGTLVFLIAFPPTLIGIIYEIVVIILNIVYDCKSNVAARNKSYFHNGCNM